MLLMFLLSACETKASASNNETKIETVPTEYAGKTNPFSSEAAPAGAEIFKAYCASCHGDTGHGDGPAGASLSPRPRNLAELQKQVGDDYLFWRINVGKEGTAMIAWKGTLTDEQIWQVIAFI